MVKITSLLAAVALSVELGAVTSASSQPVVPFVRFCAVRPGCSATPTMGGHRKFIQKLLRGERSLGEMLKKIT